MSRAIPIAAAKLIAHDYGYQQVIIYARRVGDGGLEHVTTYGIDKRHCEAAARIGDAIGRQVAVPLEEARGKAETALAALALPLLERDRNSFFECHTVRDDVETMDADERAWLQEYDDAIGALNVAKGGAS